jgi:hypothetical protein
MTPVNRLMTAFALVTCMGLAQAQGTSDFAFVDTDRNGSISPAEFAAATMRYDTETIEEAFKAIDTNGNNILSTDEIRAAEGSDDMASADSDRNGTLDWGEFAYAYIESLSANMTETLAHL